MSVDDYHLTCPVRSHFRNGEICELCVGGHEHWAVFKNCRRNMSESIINALYNYLGRRCRLYTNHVSDYITPSEFTRQWVVDHIKVAARRVHTIPYAIEIPPSTVDPAAGEYILFAGRFVPEKGVDVVIEAARRCNLPLRLSRNARHFVTVDLPPNLDVVLPKGRDELAAVYRGARMLILPSIWFETFGIVGAESMSHGVPVIASRIGAVAELVDDGIDGLLFEPGNPQDLADKIRMLWNDPEMCRRLGAAGRKKVAARWTAERHGQNLTSLYDQIWARGAANGSGATRAP